MLQAHTKKHHLETCEISLNRRKGRDFIINLAIENRERTERAWSRHLPQNFEATEGYVQKSGG